MAFECLRRLVGADEGDDIFRRELLPFEEERCAIEFAREENADIGGGKENHDRDESLPPSSDPSYGVYDTDGGRGEGDVGADGSQR